MNKFIFSALLLAAAATATNQRDVYQTLDPENGQPRGEWGPVSLCPPENKVSSFEFKYASLGNVDDTAGNGIKLYCEDQLGQLTYITSTEGLYGTWQGIRRCADPNSLLSGVRLEVLEPQGNFGDDMAVTNVQFFCNGTGEVLTGVGAFEQMDAEAYRESAHVSRRVFVEEHGRQYEKIQVQLPKAGDDYPQYGVWLQCSTGYSICGLQTNVEPDHVVDDDAGLSDALFFCC